MRASLLLGSFFVALTASATAYAASDQQFLTEAIQGDNSEIMLGRLAGQKAGAEAVKAAGATIEADHSKSLMEAKKLADAEGIKAPASPTPEASAEATKLNGLSGAQFDKEFAAYMVDDHKKDIAKFKAEAASGSGPVAKFAEMSVPVLQKHLDMAEQLVKSGK